MNRAEKEKIVGSMHERLKKAGVGIVADYTGINVPNISKLRKDLRQAKIDFFVAKKTLLKLAVKDTDFEEILGFMEGPTSIALGKDDPVALAKALVDFSRIDEHLKIKAGILNGKVIESQEVKKLAMLPSREVLLSILVSAFQSPYRGLVYTLNGILSKFVNVLSQIQKKKEKENK